MVQRKMGRDYQQAIHARQRVIYEKRLATRVGTGMLNGSPQKVQLIRDDDWAAVLVHEGTTWTRIAHMRTALAMQTASVFCISGKAPTVRRFYYLL